MDFGFHEAFVKMTKLCLEDEIIVRQFFFNSHAIRLFVLPFILKSDRIFAVVSEVGFLCEDWRFTQTACSTFALTKP